MQSEAFSREVGETDDILKECLCGGVSRAGLLGAVLTTEGDLGSMGVVIMS